MAGTSSARRAPHFSPAVPPPDGRSAPGTPHDLERAFFRALRKAIFLCVGLYVLFQLLGAITFLVLFFGLVFVGAAVLNPLVAWLQRHGIPRPVAAAAIGLSLLGGAAAALWFSVPPLLGQGQDLVRTFPQLWDGLRNRVEQFLASHPDLAVQVPTADELLSRVGPYAARLAGRLGAYSMDLVTIPASLVLLVVLVVYSLASPQPLVAGLLGAIPAQHRAKTERILGLILERLKAYALGSLLLGLVVGIMSGIGLYFLNVPFVLVFALIAGVGELLPNIGPILSAIPPILVMLAIDPMQAVWVGVLFIVVQQIENHLIVPLVMSRTLGLHPLSVTFMVLVMGALFGLLGAIIAVPVSVVIKTLYQELYPTRQDNDTDALEAQSERIVSDEGAPDAEPEAAAASA